MSKTISANVSQDEHDWIEQYCKDNQISKNELIKNSVKNTIEHKPSPKESELINQVQIPTQKIDDSNNLVESVIKELEYKNKIKREIEVETKSKYLKEFLEHLKNGHCDFWKCEICDTRNKIRGSVRS